MDQTVSEILDFVLENDIKFIRLQFCDIFGELKNISILASQLEKAFTHGISFDASSINGFLTVEDSDLFLVPDPSTLAILPWRPQEGRVARFFCYIKRPNGELFKGDCRNLLYQAANELTSSGYSAKVGPECEFYLFKTDDEAEPILIPQDKAGYFDVAPFDKGENVRREICLTLEEMGLTPESSHHESGPGQNEIDIKYGSPLESADNFITLKSVIKTIAGLNGLFASFLPKPFIDHSGSGFHVNLSLSKGEQNIFSQNGHSKESESFIAGILHRIKEITAVLNPTVNSYKRFGGYEAPKYITWSHNNRSQLIRIPASTGEYSRMELRSPDSTCNPYLAFALLIKAGLEGIREGRELPRSVDKNLYELSEEMQVETLPVSFKEALDIMKNSEFVKNALGEFIFDKYVSKKEKELESYLVMTKSEDEISEWEINNYFYKL